MDKKMKFKYFYGAEADQFSFYRIPKALFTDSYSNFALELAPMHLENSIITGIKIA